MALVTPHWGLDGLLIISCLTIALYLYATRKFKHWQKKGIKEVTPSPFFGNFADCFFQRKSAAQFLHELYAKTEGERYVGFYVFDKPFILVRDPVLVKQVLIKDFNVFPDRFAAADDVHDRLGHANLFMIKNPAWKSLRTKLSALFTGVKLKKMFDLMLEVVNDLETYIESLRLDGDGQTVDLKDLSAKVSTDMIATTAYGLKANSLNEPDAEFRKYGKMIFEFNVWRGIEFLAIFFAPGAVKPIKAKFFGKQTSQFLRTAFWQTIQQRMASGDKRNDLIDTLIELKQIYGSQDLGGYRLDGDDLVAQAAVFFTGGFETTSTTTSFTLYELALHPDIQGRLRKEILDALEQNDGKITYDTITRLQYLDMVVSETLRKYPPLGFIDRVAVQDYKIPDSDVVLEKGTPLFISMIGLHYDPKYFPDPDKYDPERFTEENKKSRPSGVYFPFGDGPKICIGMRQGLLQTKLTIVQILRKHEVAPCDKTPIPMVLDPRAIVTSALGGMYLNIRKLRTVAG